ncbi:MAG: NAD-dependent epimerase/dehydratase family protein [Dermabacter sp.]|nr:NAD-dependent epimerase/dehydratase family protein [Dermabacter sp.]
MTPRLTPDSRVLVIGGSGFIGSHMARELEARGIRFTIADLREPAFTLASGAAPDYVRLDIRDEDALTRALAGHDAVLNLAAAHHDFGVSERTFTSVNVGGARSLTAAMERAGVDNLCFYSSVAVYGEHPERPVPNENTEPDPTNAYGRSKWEAEKVYRQWERAGAGERRLLVVRPAVVFGPRNFANVHRMIDAIARRRFLPVGPGENIKSMVSVHNLLAALLQLWEADSAWGVGEEVYNYVDTPDLTSAEVIETVYRALGRRRPPVTIPVAPALAVTKPFDLAARLTGRDLPITSERVRKLAFAHTQFSAARVHARVQVPLTLTEALTEMVQWYLTVKDQPIPAPAIAPERWVPDAPYSAEADQRRVIAVVVTYNREHLIGACLDGLAAQTRPVDAVIVIDNASTDASGRLAEEHPIGAEVIHLHRNVGGAGGFTAGIAHALAGLDPDYLWIMDDDTVPFPEALENLLSVESRLDVHASVLSSNAVWTDGALHPMNSSRTRLGVSEKEVARYESVGARPIRTASFVSALLNAEDVWRHGLPWADYFIWSDDFEFTGRLLRHGHGFNVPSSRVEHRTVLFSNAQANPGERLFFDVRNKLWALVKSGSFSPVEILLYGGSAALGWTKTTVRTRGDILPVALKGLREGLFSRPRPSEAVLGADPAMAEEIRAIERTIAKGAASRKALR